MTHEQLVQMLKDEGYNHGWALHETTLTVWEFDENPPAPLTRPEA